MAFLQKSEENLNQVCFTKKLWKKDGSKKHKKAYISVVKKEREEYIDSRNEWRSKITKIAMNCEIPSYNYSYHIQDPYTTFETMTKLCRYFPNLQKIVFRFCDLHIQTLYEANVFYWKYSVNFIDHLNYFKNSIVLINIVFATRNNENEDSKFFKCSTLKLDLNEESINWGWIFLNDSPRFSVKDVKEWEQEPERYAKALKSICQDNNYALAVPLENVFHCSLSIDKLEILSYLQPQSLALQLDQKSLENLHDASLKELIGSQPFSLQVEFQELTDDFLDVFESLMELRVTRLVSKVRATDNQRYLDSKHAGLEAHYRER